MRDRKLFVGTGIRRLRELQALTQTEFASKLRISTAYLSQLETNQRPVSAPVLYALTSAFGVQVGDLLSEDPDRLGADLRDALTDPVFIDRSISNVDIRTFTVAAPWLAKRFLELHAAYRRLLEGADEMEISAAPSFTDRSREIGRRLPFEEVRDFFLHNDNYFDALDRAGEAFATKLNANSLALDAALAGYCEQKLKIRIRRLENTDRRLRSFDADAKILALHPNLSSQERAFQILCQMAWIEHSGIVDKIVVSGRFESEETKGIAESALANYFAASVVLPYGRFAQAALETRHDLIFLARMFGASLEQVCHRLSTLQRAGKKGVPMYFVKVDRAGTIVKRHNANRFQFPRFGGACPLWNVYQAFEQPNEILAQRAEMPDGSQFLCLAISVRKANLWPSGRGQRFAIGLGCELNDARHFIYADNLDLSASREATPIGISCRVCPRQDCTQRALPPTSGQTITNKSERSVIPYGIS